ncbi:MAG: Trm112 family protein [Planctomycetota bacterium]
MSESGEPVRLPEELRCPRTGRALRLSADGRWADVDGEPIRYPVRDGIPVLIADAARDRSDDERPGSDRGGEPG